VLEKRNYVPKDFAATVLNACPNLIKSPRKFVTIGLWKTSYQKLDCFSESR